MDGRSGQGNQGGDDLVNKKWAKYAALIGLVLGVVCNVIPPKYQTVCKTIANLCTGL